MAEESALVVVISPDADLRRQIAEKIAFDQAVVVTSASLELAEPLLPRLRAPDPVVAPPPATPPPVPPPRWWPADLQIDRRRMQVVHAGVKVALTRHEYELLVLMASDPDKVWKQDDLHLAVWHTESMGHLGDLHSTVKRLRRKLHAASVPLQIRSMRGFGYRLTFEPEPVG